MIFVKIEKNATAAWMLVTNTVDSDAFLLSA